MTPRFKRLIVSFAMLGVVFCFGWWLRAQVSAVPLSALMPPNALIYLEARDFGHLLTEWNNSAEKKKWLGSSNYEALSRSRLLGRLQEAQGEFEQSSGVSAQMSLLEHVAGRESAFAFYNLGALKFVYVTRMASNRIEASELWKLRSKYEPREAAGTAFFVKLDSQSHRTVAFASKGDMFIIATDEALIASTLQLLAGNAGPSLANSTWFKSVTATRAPGDLRLAYDLQQLERTPQFRTYWIQQNQTELKEFSAGLSDLVETASGFEEQRVLLRAGPASKPPGSGTLTRLVSAAPPSASLYRGWADPSQMQMSAAVSQVIYGESAQSNSAFEIAPVANSESGTLANASDLETKIDEPPTRQANAKDVAPILKTLQAMQPAALLHVQSTVAVSDNVFVTPESTIAIACNKPDLAALQNVLRSTLGPALSSGGLDPLSIRLQGNTLILSRGDVLFGTPAGNGTAAPLIYAASYNHFDEWTKYTRLFKIIDPAKVQSQNDGSTPISSSFFSGNLQSLGDTLARLKRATITRTDAGDRVTEAVNYEMK